MNEKLEQSWVYLAKAHVNLREPKGTKPTPLYLVFKLKDKQYKIPLGVKIMPTHWNKQKKQALISASLSEIENKNNFVVNCKINDINNAYNSFISYLCNHLDEINDPTSALCEYFGMKKRIKEKELISATLITALTEKKMAKASFDIFYGQLTEFIEWLKINHSNISLEEFNIEMFKEYKDFLFNKKITHKITDEKVCAENNTVANKLKNILTIIGYVEGYDELCNKLKKIVKDIKTFKQDENQIYLDDSEIEKIWGIELNGNEEIARDLFIFQLSSGQRYSDIYKLCGINLKECIVGDMISIVQKKTKAKVSFPINAMAKSVLGKYSYRLPKMKNQEVNANIKTICQKVGLNEICHCVELRGDDIYEYDAYKWQLVGTHTTRRSFISNAIKENIDTAIIRKITGHKSGAFERYNRIDGEDAVKAMLNASKSAGNNPTIASNDNGGQSTVNELEECRKVLFYLGASPIEVYQDDDIERIHRLIYSFEHVIYEKCGVDYVFLKDLFNSDKPFIDKINIIQSLINKQNS